MNTVRAALAVALLYASQAVVLHAETDVTGEWAATIAAPRGALEYTMYAKESIDCTMTGTVKGETISGDATLAKVGKGAFHAERTAS
jgi:hypothetical protein